MRKLSKPWPPADVSPDGQAARSFSDAESEYLAELPNAANRTEFARSEFDRIEKAKLRQVMYREQKSLCVFCERRVAEGHPAPRIDHWRPLSANHGLAIHWENLCLSCPTPETCDVAKGESSLRWDDTDPDLPWPTQFDYERHLGFTSRGEIYVRNDTGLNEATRRALELAIDDQADGSRTRPAILNLNHPAQVAARAAAMDSERTRINRDFSSRTATLQDRQSRANSMLRQNPLEPFISIRVCWLRRNMGKGK